MSQINGYNDKGKLSSFIGQFVNPVGEERMDKGDWGLSLSQPATRLTLLENMKIWRIKYLSKSKTIKVSHKCQETKYKL